MQHYRVCFADTDAMGFVYHARYFEIAERSRGDALRSTGYAMRELYRGREGVALAVHSLTAKFTAPAFVDDFLDLHTALQKHNPARTVWRTDITRDGAPICAIGVEIVCLDLATKQPVLMPPALAEALTRVPRTADARITAESFRGAAA